MFAAKRAEQIDKPLCGYREQCLFHIGGWDAEFAVSLH
jgi:hypothetical protein